MPEEWSGYPWQSLSCPHPKCPLPATYLVALCLQCDPTVVSSRWIPPECSTSRQAQTVQWCCQIINSCKRAVRDICLTELEKKTSCLICTVIMKLILCSTIPCSFTQKSLLLCWNGLGLLVSLFSIATLQHTPVYTYSRINIFCSVGLYNNQVYIEL